MSITPVIFRQGTLALVEETKSGVLEKPAANTDFVALQPDIAITPVQETLANEQLQASLMASKNILGRQTATFSMSHYFKSGEVTGGNPAAPDYGLMLKAAMGSLKEVTSEQAITSVTDEKTFAVADASQYSKGDTLLIQTTSGNHARPIAGISTNIITLGFELPTLPNVGALIGLPVTYAALNDSNQIPTLSAWHYMNNTIQAVPGVRMESVDISMPAGELINASFSGSGLGYYKDALIIDATNDQLNIEISATPHSASIPQQAYHDEYELAEACALALNAIPATGVVFSVSYNDNGKFTFTGDSAFALDGTQANTILPTMAFDAVLTAELTSHTSPNLIDLTSGLSPVYDDSQPLASKSNLLLIGKANKNECVNNASVDIALANTKADLLDACEASAIGATILNERTNTWTVVTWVQEYESRFFRDLRKGETISIFVAASEIEGGQFTKGKTASCYASHATVNDIAIADSDGAAQITMEITAFNPGDSTESFYYSFV